MKVWYDLKNKVIKTLNLPFTEIIEALGSKRGEVGMAAQNPVRGMLIELYKQLLYFI